MREEYNVLSALNLRTIGQALLPVGDRLVNRQGFTVGLVAVHAVVAIPTRSSAPSMTTTSSVWMEIRLATRSSQVPTSLASRGMPPPSW